MKTQTIEILENNLNSYLNVLSMTNSTYQQYKDQLSEEDIIQMENDMEECRKQIDKINGCLEWLNMKIVK
jgi:hypothetical protein